MPLKSIKAESLTDPEISHGFFTRAGGVSQGIYEGLNCGTGSDDVSANVIENRAQIAVELSGRRDTPIVSCYQIHSNKAVKLDSAWGEDERPKADAMVTNRPNIILGILTADCAPVLFHDPVAHVIGAAHAGWQGALYGIVENTIKAMEELGGSRDNIIAAVGPAIGPKSYEVGEEFYQKFLDEDKAYSQYFWAGADHDHHMFDLPHFVRARLEETGLKKSWISDEDTYASESLFYSYRRSTHRNEGDYGRQLSAIMLKT